MNIREFGIVWASIFDHTVNQRALIICLFWYFILIIVDLEHYSHIPNLRRVLIAL